MAVAAADAAAASSQSSLHPLSQQPQTPSNISTTDLHTLQMALQQQQQHLQQQLQSFLLLQTPTTTQASAMIAQSQVQRAVVQASNQLRQLQSQKHQQQNSRSIISDTPKSMPKSPDFNGREDFLVKSNGRPTSTQRPITTTTTSSHSSSSPPPLTSLSPSPFSPFSPLRSMSPLLMQQQQQHQQHQQQQSLVGRLDLPADENIDLEELERFAKEFKQRRIKLG